jgi:putative protease
MKPIEVLAPAGSIEALDAAIGEGADAVYLGLKSFNARMRTTNFAWSQFEAAVRSLHRMKRRIYVTVNTVFEQRESDRMYQLLKYLAAVGPDGLIVQDFGVARMVKDHFPSLKLHASTQMNVASAKGVNLLSKFGFNRVVLSRELDLDEIRSIRSSCNSELEVFVHGALCVSCSGLCLFSSYLGGKSANRGMCTQACRRRYRLGSAEDAPEAGSRLDLWSEERLDEGAAGGADSSSGYYFSPADLQLIDKVPDLAAAGVSSFKIEGRMKSAEYVGIVVSPTGIWWTTWKATRKRRWPRRRLSCATISPVPRPPSTTTVPRPPHGSTPRRPAGPASLWGRSARCAVPAKTPGRWSADPTRTASLPRREIPPGSIAPTIRTVNPSNSPPPIPTLPADTGFPFLKASPSEIQYI